ncbi:Type III secretion system inner membrane R protein [Methylocella tundrae]|uniref:Type III secretion system inner membrane R protein n=1 Tax=Methylocella tundrae TaxID=227605 RepID=A0A8B6M5F4_METTU|nr:Type III secretion system inner membrane R protein [Methylocella tundrae]VTZ50058.1 Type III secretion system inner membrane R protein [Methylocella tundrae]
MIAIGSEAVLSVFVLFCRIGACLMLMPGISGPRIPVKVRLFLSFGITLGLAPLLSTEIEPKLSEARPFALLQIILSESLVGALIGFLGRIFFGALETLASAIAMAIGLSSPLTPPPDDSEPLPAIVSLISLGATVLLFLTNLHWEVLRGLIASYDALPVSGLFNTQFGLIQIGDRLARSFLLTLRISSPFILYSLIINLAVGLAGKFAPQIPIYFVTVPAVAMGGLFLLYLTCSHLLELFTTGFATWLISG